MDFRDEGNWILPTNGTFGNKASNLLSNTPSIYEAGLKVPRSLVIPFEYIRDSPNYHQFILETIDKIFPRWTRSLIRSNSPDEDLGLRFPGLYTSEDIWHKDRDFAETVIDRVLDSYNNPAAKLRRQQLGLPELGMCLLIMEPVTNESGKFLASNAGSFSDIGELGILTMVDQTKGLEAMLSKPLKRLKIGQRGYPVDGYPVRSYTPQELELSLKMRDLASRLPQTRGKGWEIEFVSDSFATYVVQTTKITKTGSIQIPEKAETIFSATDVYGTAEIISNGILYLGVMPDTLTLSKFDSEHANYCLATDPFNLSISGEHNILRHVLNPSAILSINYDYAHAHAFSQHVEQYMREGRAAMEGKFDTPILGNFNFRTGEIINANVPKSWTNIYFSPTRLRILADEVSGRGGITLDGKILPFEELQTTY